ncbi:histidine phosphatase family protein [Candidatus Thorarchaeota archaeon]|nr:MAG: histidine phosphatase family protein [Candidatus Thorarchaeota archaeon]
MKMMSDWEREEWIHGAKTLLSWLQNLEQELPVMLLVRHSHRDVLRDQKDMLGQGLTELGKKLSIEFGRRLPLSRKIHLFFSIVPRCYETAEAIAHGFSEQGGEIIDMDPLPTLVRPEYTQQEVWKNLQPNGENVTEFVNRWAEKEFDGIEPFDDFKMRLIDDTLTRLLRLSEPQMHVHVTHDLSLMASKRMFFNRPLEWEDREPFLGGLCVTIRNGKPILFVSDREEPVRSSLLPSLK